MNLASSLTSSILTWTPLYIPAILAPLLYDCRREFFISSLSCLILFKISVDSRSPVFSWVYIKSTKLSSMMTPPSVI
jgi:hypothetical protein